MLQNIKLRRPGKDAETLLQAAGFREATPLQKQYLATASQERDVIVESTEGEGKTIAQLLPFLSAPKSRKKGSAALILTDSVESVEKYEREYRRFSGSVTRGKALIALGKAQLPKKELKLFSKRPDIIVGTTKRIIDHIRRENLSFSEEITVVVDTPRDQEQEEYNRDIEFILTKIPHTRSISIFASAREQVESIEYLLKRPVGLYAEDRTKRLPPFHIYETERPSASTLHNIFYAHQYYSALLLVDSYTQAYEYRRFLEKNGIICLYTDRSGTPTEKERVGEEPKEKETSRFLCTITVFDDAYEVGFHYDAVFFYGIPGRESLFMEVAHTVSSFSQPPTLSIILSSEERDTFTTLQEKYQMNSKDEQLPDNEDVLKGRLKSLVKQIKEEENPDLLNTYKKLVKKSVPITLRGYLTAYLLKQFVEGGGGDDSTSQSGENKEMQTIFVSIGKNRKVFPKDLAGLFRSKVDLGPNDIGNIKVLDNYSFIDIPKNRAQEAIDQMDNMEYRGRTITVNFARKKKGKKGASEGKKPENNKGN